MMDVIIAICLAMYNTTDFCENSTIYSPNLVYTLQIDKALSENCSAKNLTGWYVKLSFEGQAVVNVTDQTNDTDIDTYTPPTCKTTKLMRGSTYNTTVFFQVKNNRFLKMFIFGSTNIGVQTICSKSSIKDICQTPPGAKVNYFLIVGASMMGTSIILIFTVVISICCIIKKHKRRDKREDSKNIKSSAGDTYEVIRDTEVGRFGFPPNSYSAINGTNTENSKIPTVSTGRGSKSSGKSNTVEFSSDQPHSLYTLADGNSEGDENEFSDSLEDYEVISEAPANAGFNCKVATPFLLATHSGALPLPKLKSVANQRKGAQGDTCSVPDTQPHGSTKPDVKESTYQGLDRSGRSRSIDLAIIASYDDVVDVRTTKFQRQHCKTAEAVPNHVVAFDFSPRSFSENIYSLQKNAETLMGDNDGVNSEEHIYEAYDRNSCKGNDTPKTIEAGMLNPPSSLRHDSVYDKCQIVQTYIPAVDSKHDEISTSGSGNVDKYEQRLGSDLVPESASTAMLDPSSAASVNKDASFPSLLTLDAANKEISAPSTHMSKSDITEMSAAFKLDSTDIAVSDPLILTPDTHSKEMSNPSILAQDTANREMPDSSLPTPDTANKDIPDPSILTPSTPSKEMSNPIILTQDTANTELDDKNQYVPEPSAMM